jgi:hypothetical protein
MVWCGLISYPLYLWHWPLLSFAKIVEDKPSSEVRVALVFVSVFLAWLTCKGIERPLRFGKHKKIPLFLVISLFITGLLGYSSVANDGYDGQGFREKEKTEFANYFKNGLPEWQYFERENIPEKYRAKCDFYNAKMYRLGKSTSIPVDIDKECYSRDTSIENSLLLWGDSHAAQLYFGLYKNLPKNWKILQITTSGCAPKITSLHDSNTNCCEKSNWFAMETIKKQRPNVVIVGQSMGHNVEKMSSIGLAIESLGVKKVIFTGPTPHWNSDLPEIILRNIWVDTPERTFISINTDVLATDQSLKKNFISSSSIIFVSIIDYFCNENGCLTRIGSDKKCGITTWDYGHLTPIASDAFAKNVLVPLVVTPIH